MAASDLPKRFLTDKKIRNVAILVVLLLLLPLVLYFRFFKDKKIPAGAMRIVFCPECDIKLTRRIVDIEDTEDPNNFCRECESKLEYGWKCKDCSYEFALHKPKVPVEKMKTMDKFRAVTEMQSCPNCKSKDTVPIPIK